MTGYKEKLKEYKSMLDGMINWFWIGGKDDNMMMEQACVTPHIAILPEDSKIMPKAKTSIQLCYGSKKQPLKGATGVMRLTLLKQ